MIESSLNCKLDLQSMIILYISEVEELKSVEENAENGVPPSDVTTEDPPLSQVEKTASKFESARETRRQARRKLLEKMEEEGKLKTEAGKIKVPDEAETVEVNTPIVPKKKTRRRRVRIALVFNA